MHRLGYFTDSPISENHSLLGKATGGRLVPSTPDRRVTFLATTLLQPTPSRPKSESFWHYSFIFPNILISLNVPLQIPAALGAVCAQWLAAAKLSPERWGTPFDDPSSVTQACRVDLRQPSDWLILAEELNHLEEPVGHLFYFPLKKKEKKEKGD